jgi:hypothetical protein
VNVYEVVFKLAVVGPVRVEGTIEENVLKLVAVGPVADEGKVVGV